MTEENPTTTTETPVTAPAAEPSTNKGSGQFAVWNHDLAQFVSGVGDKATATAMKKSLAKAEHNGGPLEGHKLEVLEV